MVITTVGLEGFSEPPSYCAQRDTQRHHLGRTFGILCVNVFKLEQKERYGS
jgi:hypothetical protein